MMWKVAVGLVEIRQITMKDRAFKLNHEGTLVAGPHRPRLRRGLLQTVDRLRFLP